MVKIVQFSLHYITQSLEYDFLDDKDLPNNHDCAKYSFFVHEQKKNYSRGIAKVWGPR